MVDYKYTGPERRVKNGNGTGVTWKWIAGAMMAVTTLISGAWLTANSNEITGLKLAQQSDRKEQQEMKTEVGVIKEKARRIEEDVKDVKEQQKEQGKKLDDTNRKLDELLRRSR